MKTPGISPPIKYSIPNQDITRNITKQDPILKPLLAKRPTEYKPFMNDEHFKNKTKDEHNDSTDDLRTDNEVFVNKLNVKRTKIRKMNTKKII